MALAKFYKFKGDIKDEKHKKKQIMTWVANGKSYLAQFVATRLAQKMILKFPFNETTVCLNSKICHSFVNEFKCIYFSAIVEGNRKPSFNF